MRRRQQVALTVVLTTLLFTAASFLLAQPGSRGCSMMQSYDPAAEVVIRGTVDGVETPECPMHGKGIHLEVTSEGQAYEVHLGPDWFVTEQESFTVEPGDEVTVTGALEATEDTEGTAPMTLMAREIATSDRTLTLRDETGVPAWAGSGRGRRNRS